MKPTSTAIMLIPNHDGRINGGGVLRGLKEMVLASVQSEHSQRNYAKALDEVWSLCQKRQEELSRSLLRWELLTRKAFRH